MTRTPKAEAGSNGASTSADLQCTTQYLSKVCDSIATTRVIYKVGFQISAARNFMKPITRAIVLLDACAIAACGDSTTAPNTTLATLYLGRVNAQRASLLPFTYLISGSVTDEIVSDSIVLYHYGTYYRDLVRDSIVTPTCTPGGTAMCALPDTTVISEPSIGTYTYIGSINTSGSAFVLTNASDNSTYTGFVDFTDILE
jgi:hypothetical protein